MSTIKLHQHPEFAVVMADIKRASRHIATYAHRTPVMTCQKMDALAGHQLFFKCENLQKTGAFKFRGAINAVSHLTPEQLAQGVVTHSSGNHAGALALAAKLFRTQAYVVMPENSLKVKREAVLEYGGEVIDCAPNQAAREAAAAEVQQRTKATMIPPYDHPHVIAGQGTAVLELIQQVPNLDIVIAPVGGGGLMSGTAIAARELSPRIKVFGAEPVGADDAARSKQTNRWVPQTNPQTIADGLRTSLGELTWPIIQRKVQKIITVTEEEIVTAMRHFWQRTKFLIEPSSAVAVAAALKAEEIGEGPRKNIGIIISGGNVDLDQLPW